MVVALTARPIFYVGQFGLEPNPANFSMTILEENGILPSISYGYVVGAYCSMFLFLPKAFILTDNRIS